MKGATLIRSYARLAYSFSSTQQLGLQPLTLNQVTHSYNTQSSTIPLIKIPQSGYVPPYLNQNLRNSSKQESFVHLILSSNDWSQQIEYGLENINPKMFYQFVVYVLKNLKKNPQKSLSFYKWVRDKKEFEPRDALVYSILLRTLACKDFEEEFWDIAFEMKEKGIEIDGKINRAIIRALKYEKMDEMLSKWIEFSKSLKKVNSVVKVILGAKWSEEVKSELMKLKFPLSDGFLSRVIGKLEEEPLKALKFFNWFGTLRRNNEHNKESYVVMVKILARHGFMCKFWDLVMQMRQKGFEIDYDSYIKITRLVGNVDTVKLIEFMMGGPYSCKLSEQECVRLLMTLARDNEPDLNLVMRVVNKYLEAGNGYTKGIYYVIHRVLCKLGRFGEAKDIVENLKNSGHKPDNIIYSQEIYGLCKYNRFEDAHLALDQMEAEGCVPSRKTWTTLIQWYCSAGQIDQAVFCFGEMLNKNIASGAVILHVLINGFKSHNNSLGAYRFLVEISDKAQLKPRRATYKHMIGMLLKDGKFEEAFDLLSMMKQHNYAPCFDLFVGYISKHGTVTDALRLLRALLKKGHASTSAHVKVISSVVKEGRQSDARTLLDGCALHVHKNEKIQKLFGMTENIEK